jgi:hypothetical protein
MSSPRGYQHYFESWSPAEIGQQESLVEDLRNWFVEQTLDTRIEQALPTLAKIQSQGNAMKEAQIFENWANQIMEGTWALPDTPEAQEKLNTLMSSELIVGPDAVNATELLYDVIGDDELFDILSDLAQRDPRANIWDDSDVQARLAELGIQTPQSTEAEPADVAQDTAPGQQGVAEAAKWRDPKYQGQTFDYDDSYEGPGDTRAGKVSLDRAGMRQLPGQTFDPLGYKAREKQATGKLTPRDVKYATAKNFEKEKQQQTDYDRSRKAGQGVAEGKELTDILRYAGVSVKESVLTDSTGATLDHILKRFSREVSDFKQTGELDRDLFEALYDYYFDDMPYGIKKARTGDPDEWIGDRLAAELGMNEADNISTFEVMSGFDAPVAEGSCNMTTEGEYCPEHGLSECAMEEGWKSELAGGTAGGVAGTLAGAAIGGPVGGLVGGALGGTGGAMIGREMTKEDGKDPMDHRGAVTDSFYESQQVDELARIKSLLHYK